MSHLLTIQTSKLRVGDIVHVYAGSMIFANQKVTVVAPSRDYIGTEAIDDGATEGFRFTNLTYTFFLVERAKQPLPTEIGRVVEVDGVKYFRVLEDNNNCPEWAYDDEGYISVSSSEQMSAMDYTVV